MLSLSLGLAAALAWAVHDLLVRKLTQGAAMLPMLLVVLAAGIGGAAGAWRLCIGGWETMGRAAIVPAGWPGWPMWRASGGLVSGAVSRAPVRLVAPMLGAFPMLSLAHCGGAGARGGDGGMAGGGGHRGGHCLGRDDGRRRAWYDRAAVLAAALGWAALGAVGFAATFALGQEAARQGAEVPAMVVTRIVALAGVLALCLVIGRQIAPRARRICRC